MIQEMEYLKCENCSEEIKKLVVGQPTKYQYEVENTVPCVNLDLVIHDFESRGFSIVSILQTKIGYTRHYSYDVVACKVVGINETFPGVKCGREGAANL